MAANCSLNAREAMSLLALTSRPDYDARVAQIVRKISRAVDSAEALGLLDEATHRLGAEVSAFVSFVRDDQSREMFRFLLACDAAWCIEYEEQAWYGHDPWLTYAKSNSEPIRSSELPIGSKNDKTVLDLAAKYGFTSAVIFPAPSSGNTSRTGVLCLGSSIPGFFDDDGYIGLKVAARGLAMELHEWWIKQIRHELVNEANLTEDDLALLQHEHRGHSSKTIAAELDTSPSSIDSRFQRLNQKLRVPNRKAAAALAAEYGLI